MLISTLCLLAALPLSDAEAEAKVAAIVPRMSLDEKVSMLGGIGTFYMKGYPAYGMPEAWGMSDGSHGLGPEHGRIGRWDTSGSDDRSTVLPAMSALAATWSVACAKTHGDVMGEQVRAYGKDEMLGPGVNIMRNPLCGRNWEYFSEDPCLAGEMSAALIAAAQSHGIACTVKHFAANAQELDRMAVDTVVDERTLNEIYFPAFECAVKKGGALAVMTAYNRVNGVFASENPYLQTEILRRRWGFKGMIVSDWGGQHSCVPAALAGADVEMFAPSLVTNFTDHLHHRLPLADAVRRGEVPEARVDEMVSHVLFMMAKTGSLGGAARERGERLTPRHRAMAESIAEESIVLLKNEAKTLPLTAASLRKVVVLGQLATTEHTPLGNSAAAHAVHEVTPLEGLAAYLGSDVEIVRFPLGAEGGGKIHEIDRMLVKTVDPNAGESFAVPAWERFLWKGGEGTWVDEKAERGYVTYPSAAKALGLSFRAKVTAPESGLFTLSVSSANGGFDASLFVDGVRVGNGYKTIGGGATLAKGKTYEIRLDVCNPGAEACDFTFGWIPPSARAADGAVRDAACRAADAVLVFTGTSLGYGRAREQEAGDRPDLKLPDGHDAEIAALLKMNLRNLVVITHSGSPLELPWVDACPTLLHQPYLGETAGTALARVLFGAVNPSGKLPCTWPRQWADTPVARKGTYQAGRVELRERFYVGYRWYDRENIAPMFPFGYGLSYATFAYAKAGVTVSGDGEGRKALVSVDVTNTGTVAGREVVQLYVAPVDAKVERCVKDLRAFAKTRLLKPGETETLAFELTDRAFAYYDETRHTFVAPSGDYRILLAASAADVRQTLDCAWRK